MLKTIRKVALLIVFQSFFIGYGPLQAQNLEGELLSLGEYKIVNTAGFIEEKDHRIALTPGPEKAAIRLSRDGAEKVLQLAINKTAVTLHRLDSGLADLKWDTRGTKLMQATDIASVAGKTHPKDVPAWGALVDWPGYERVTLVVFEYKPLFFGGFLISHTDQKTVVRQMELHRLAGPRHRAPPSLRSSGDGARN